MKLPTEPKPRCTDLTQYKFAIYGIPGAGKSTLASKFPGALFVPTEPGLNYLEVHQITDDDGNPKICKNWTEFCQAIRIICATKHDFKTIVIDTVDNALEFCALHTLASRGVEHESDEGFGKGWNMITREFKKAINHLTNSGFGVVFISHEKTGQKETKGVKRIHTDMSLSNQGKTFINGLVDFVFFTYVDNDHKRWMQTKATPNVNAKDRTGHLPPVMPIDFDNMKKEIEIAFQKQEMAQSEPKPQTTTQPRPIKNHAPGAK